MLGVLHSTASWTRLFLTMACTLEWSHYQIAKLSPCWYSEGESITIVRVALACYFLLKTRLPLPREMERKLYLACCCTTRNSTQPNRDEQWNLPTCFKVNGLGRSSCPTANLPYLWSLLDPGLGSSRDTVKAMEWRPCLYCTDTCLIPWMFLMA